MANFKDGIIRDGNTVGTGKTLGNIKDGVIRVGNAASAGGGNVVGNVKDGVIRVGNNASAGGGNVIGNVKDGVIRVGNNASAGGGNVIGNVKDGVIRAGSGGLGQGEIIAKIKGTEGYDDDEIVAAYHFLIKEIIANTTNNRASNTINTSAFKNANTPEQIGRALAESGIIEMILSKAFGFLERIVGKTGAKIIVLATILYVFRGFFIELFTSLTTDTPPPICVGLC